MFLYFGLATLGPAAAIGGGVVGALTGLLALIWFHCMVF